MRFPLHTRKPMSKFVLVTRNGSQTAELEMKPAHLYDGVVTLVPKEAKVASSCMPNHPNNMAFQYQKVAGAIATSTTMSLKMGERTIVQDKHIGFMLNDRASKRQDVSASLSNGVTALASFSANSRGHQMDHFALDVPYKLTGMMREEQISSAISRHMDAVLERHEIAVGSARGRRRKRRKNKKRKQKAKAEKANQKDQAKDKKAKQEKKAKDTKEQQDKDASDTKEKQEKKAADKKKKQDDAGGQTDDQKKKADDKKQGKEKKAKDTKHQQDKDPAHKNKRKEQKHG